MKNQFEIQLYQKRGIIIIYTLEARRRTKKVNFSIIGLFYATLTTQVA